MRARIGFLLILAALFASAIAGTAPAASAQVPPRAAGSETLKGRDTLRLRPDLKEEVEAWRKKIAQDPEIRKAARQDPAIRALQIQTVNALQHVSRSLCAGTRPTSTRT